MHATHLLAKAIPPAEREPLPAHPVQDVCCLTGLVGPCIPRGHLFGRSFTDQHLLRRPDSPFVGVDAWVALKYKWERMSSWLCDGKEFLRLDRQGVRKHVISGIPSTRPWAAYATTSYKKHGSLSAPVNSGSRQQWLFEMRMVDCSDRALVAEWWAILNRALRDGIGRSSMEYVEMPPALMRKVGIVKWEAFRAWARDKKQSSLYAFLCYLLPSQEELKSEAKS